MKEWKLLARCNLILVLIALLIVQPVLAYTGRINGKIFANDRYLIRLDDQWIKASRVWETSEYSVYVATSGKIADHIVPQIIPASSGCVHAASDGCLWSVSNGCLFGTTNGCMACVSAGSLWSTTGGALWSTSNSCLWYALEDCEWTNPGMCLWCMTSGNLFGGTSGNLWHGTNGDLWCGTSGCIWHKATAGDLWYHTNGHIWNVTAGNLLQNILAGNWRCFRGRWVASAGILWGLSGSDMMEKLFASISTVTDGDLWNGTSGKLWSGTNGSLWGNTNGDLLRWMFGNGRYSIRPLLHMTNGDLRPQAHETLLYWICGRTAPTTGGNLWFISEERLWVTNDGIVWYILSGDLVCEYIRLMCEECTPEDEDDRPSRPGKKPKPGRDDRDEVWDEEPWEDPVKEPLPQTGSIFWPIYLLAGAGGVLMLLGAAIKKRSNRYRGKYCKRKI